MRDLSKPTVNLSNTPKLAIIQYTLVTGTAGIAGIAARWTGGWQRPRHTHITRLTTFDWPRTSRSLLSGRGAICTSSFCWYSTHRPPLSGAFEGGTGGY
jgi:hypothetical protein